MTDPRIQTIRQALPTETHGMITAEKSHNAARALASLAADLEAARETLLVISGWDASAAKRHAAMGMREYAAAALARLSAGKETEDIAFERSLLRADIKAGNADAAAEQLRRVRTLEGDNDGASV